MTRQEVFEFINANPAFSLATCEGSQPKVRIIQLFRADDSGIIFAVGRDKAVCRQLKANAAIEMCFFRNSDKPMTMRVTGKAEEINDLDLKKEIVEVYTFLKPWVEAEGYDVLSTFKVVDPVASPWTMEINFESRQLIAL